MKRCRSLGKIFLFARKKKFTNFLFLITSTLYLKKIKKKINGIKQSTIKQLGNELMRKKNYKKNITNKKTREEDEDEHSGKHVIYRH